MSSRQTILERLARPGAPEARTARENTSEVVRSVLRNLQRILNARLGHAPAQPDLGMPAPSEIVRSGADASDWLGRTLKECVEKYEPRLADVRVARVESEDDVLSLRFQLDARLAGEKEEIPVSFDTQVDPAGRIRVRD